MTSAPRHDSFQSVLLRAIAMVAEETAALRDCRPLDHSAFAARKNMIAFELERLGRPIETIESDDATRDQVKALRARLNENRALLEIHISASREIARILADIARLADSDGTYNVARAERGRRL